MIKLFYKLVGLNFQNQTVRTFWEALYQSWQKWIAFKVWRKLSGDKNIPFNLSFMNWVLSLWILESKSAFFNNRTRADLVLSVHTFFPNMENEEMISYSFDMIQMNCFVVEENGETLLFQCMHMLESLLLSLQIRVLFSKSRCKHLNVLFLTYAVSIYLLLGCTVICSCCLVLCFWFWF